MAERVGAERKKERRSDGITQAPLDLNQFVRYLRDHLLLDKVRR
jgi:hypothetical protein